jgi:hypothetical protein
VINSAPYARNMVGHRNCAILMTLVSSIPTALLSIGMGVQEVHEDIDILIKIIQTRENVKGQVSLR